MNTVFVLLMNQAPGQAHTLIRPSVTFSLIGRRKWGAILCVQCFPWAGLRLAKRLGLIHIAGCKCAALLGLNLFIACDPGLAPGAIT